MYYGYCFIEIDGQYTPKVKLETLEEVFTYCRLQHALFPEVRITDEYDFCVLHVVNHVIYVPLQNGNFSALSYQTNEMRNLTREQMETEIEAQKVGK